MTKDKKDLQTTSLSLDRQFNSDATPINYFPSESTFASAAAAA